MRSSRMAPNSFVAPAGNWFKYGLHGPFPLLLARRRWINGSCKKCGRFGNTKGKVLQVGPKNRYFPLSSNAAGATFIIVAVQESTRSGETRGPRERSAPWATVYKTIRRGLRRQVPLQEGAGPADGAGLAVPRVLSGEAPELR